jgi:hypothetical protein
MVSMKEQFNEQARRQDEIFGENLRRIKNIGVNFGRRKEGEEKMRLTS